jgi:adenosylcobinamide kinase / adenosylcobinamide-phosphate guanylyltransferase
MRRARRKRALPDRATLTFVLGGARSGKSAHAETLLRRHPAPWHYIATAQAFDEEMAERIAMHRARRDNGWRTIDAPHDLTEALDKIPQGAPVLLDCLTLWLSNRMLAEADMASDCAELAERLARPRGPWFVVSNEVGLSIVPDNALARRFRDEAGRLNQKVAAMADEVIFLVAGLPMKVK